MVVSLVGSASQHPGGRTEPPDPAAAVGEAVLGAMHVRDFRNLERIDLEVPASGFVVLGDNGHGKTNLLETIGYFHALRSPRGARDLDLVRFDAPAFHLSAQIVGTSADRVGAGFERATRRKRVTLDDVPQARLSDALGALPSVTISPRDVALVSGAPGERRRFLDVLLALSSRRYLTALQAYRQALVRRNATLRTSARSSDVEARLAAWDGPLSDAGAVLWETRRSWVAGHVRGYAALSAAMGERDVAELRYHTALDPGSNAGDTAAIAAALREQLQRHRAQDLRRGLTHAGPHRDDLELRLGGRPLRVFGSAGQQRSGAMALRLLECETLRERLGCEPVLLLDDPFAELDPGRSESVLTLLTSNRRGQTVLAVPRPNDIPREWMSLARWRLRDGSLSHWSAADA